MKKFLLVCSAAALFTGTAQSKPPFDVRLEAKRSGDGLRISAIIANNSRQSACFMAVNQGSVLFHYSDGRTGVEAVNSEPSWRDGMPPPALIQVVLADGISYHYPWLYLDMPPSSPGKEPPISVDTTFVLDKCEPFFANGKYEQRKLLEVTLSAPIEQ